jgi:hypothetical protein
MNLEATLLHNTIIATMGYRVSRLPDGLWTVDISDQAGANFSGGIGFATAREAESQGYDIVQYYITLSKAMLAYDRDFPVLE